MRLVYAFVLAACSSAMGFQPGGEFGYQGRLTDGGAAVTGTADVRFELFDADVGGTSFGVDEHAGVAVADGLFDVVLDFGADALSPDAGGTGERWLEVSARTPSGVGSYTTLGPRQRLRATPFAQNTRGLSISDTTIDNGFVAATIDIEPDPTQQPARASFDFDAEGGSLLLRDAGGTTFAELERRVSSNMGGGLSLSGPNSFVDLTAALENARLDLYYGPGPGAPSPGYRVELDAFEAGSKLTLWDAGGNAPARLESNDDFGTSLIFPGPSGALSYLGQGSNGTPELTLFGSQSTFGFNTGRADAFSLTLPVRSVTAADQRDEPGIASETANFSILLSGGVETLLSRSISVPVNGYCVVIASMETWAAHSTGTFTSAVFGVSDDPNALPTNQDVELRFSTGVPSGSFDTPVTVHGAFEVFGGQNTFYLLGELNSGSVTVSDIQLTVMFFPTARGAVTPTAVGRDDEPAGSALTTAEIYAEQRASAAFDERRRSEEAEAYRREIKALRAEMAALRADHETLRRDVLTSPDEPD